MNIRPHPSIRLRHLILVLLVLTLGVLPTTRAAALASPPTGQFTYFYIPPQDGTAAVDLATFNRTIILTHGDETYRSSLRSSGYTGPVYEYLGAAEVDGPGPYANSSAPCNYSYQPRRNQIALDVGDFCTYLHPNESYFLHNSSGARLYEQDGSHVVYHMNPAAPGWRNFFVQRALREKVGDASHAPTGYDGLFLDNVWVSLWTLTNKMLANSGGHYPQEYSSDSAYESAMAGFLSQLKTGIGTWRLLGNMAGDSYDANSWNAYLPYVDGGMEEAFATDWSAGYRTPSQWLADVQKAEQVAAQGKIFLAITQGAQSDTARMRFGYGSFLLAMQPNKTFFRYAKASQGYEYQWTYPNYWTDIGGPAGARYQLSDGSWRRNFTKGYVVVNPSTLSVQIVQTASQSTGQKLLFLPIVMR